MMKGSCVWRLLLMCAMLLASCVNSTSQSDTQAGSTGPAPAPAPTTITAVAPAPISASTPMTGVLRSVVRLPNLLVQATSRIEIRRFGSVTAVTTTVGAALSPGDLLILRDGEAAFFCADEASWDDSPTSLIVGEWTGIPCGVGAPPRAAPDLVSVRSRSGDTLNAQVPNAPSELRVLSPRSGRVLGDRPALVWTEISGASGYTVTLHSDDQILREPVVTQQAWLPYPAQWQPLQGNEASYRLEVQGAGQVTDSATPGFLLVDESARQEITALEAQLRQHARLDDVARHLLLAHLYLGYDLRSETITILAELPNAADLVAVQRLLGDAYLEMGLVVEAQSAYARLLELAEANGLVEEKAAALVGSGRVACVRLDADAAASAWQHAQALYLEIDQTEQAKVIGDLLAKLAANCQ